MGKSSHHKSKNTFKFNKFSDRISNLKIDVIHRIKRPEENAEETDTYFGTALFKWCSLNLTNDFNNFKTEISDQVKTFVQLVHHSDEIVTSLMKHLAVPNSMAYDALLDLVVQLAKDLQHDFYKHFPDVFKVLVALLKAHPQDVQLLEMIFTCLSYLFKFLWRYMIKDIKNIFRYFSPLFSTLNKPYIREFAAESFAFLIRKVKDQSELFDFVFASLNKHPQHTAGISRLLFEVMKNVQNHVHFCAVKVFPVILSKLGPDLNSENVPNKFILDQIEVCVTQTMGALANHVDGTDHISNLWPLLLEEITKHQQSWLKGENFAAENIERLLNVMSVWIEFKHGALVSNPDEVSNTLSAILKTDNILPDSTLNAVLNCVSLLIYGCYKTLNMSSLSRVVNLSFNKKFDADIVYPFAKTLFLMPLFEKNVLYPLTEFMQLAMKGESNLIQEKSLLMATELILSKSPPALDATELDGYQQYFIDFDIVLKRTCTNKVAFSNYIHSLISDLDLNNRQQLVLTWAAIVCMPHIRPQSNTDDLKKSVQKLWVSITRSDEKHPLQDLHLFVLAQAVQCLYLMVEESQFFACITLDKVELLLESFGDNVHALQIADIFFWFTSRSTNVKNAYGPETCVKLYSFIEKNLSSASHQIRLLTVQIFSQFELALPLTDTPDVTPTMVFNICLDAERIPRTVQEYREIIKHLQKLDSCLIANSIPTINQRFNQVPLRFLLGNLFCNFKPLWEPVRKLITSHATSMSKEDFWEVFGGHLKEAAFNCENNVQRVSICDHPALVPAEEDTELDISLLQIFRDQVESSVKRDTLSANVDHFREQLWKTMLNFPQVCENNSKLMAQLLFQFIENEFNLVNKDSMARQNILNKEWKEKMDEIEEEKMETDVEDEEETDVNMEEETGSGDETEREEMNDIQPVVHKPQKDLNNLLVSHLQLFSNFRHGNSLSCSQKLKDLFEMLLENKEPMIQKIAFECLLIFPMKGIANYRENFMRILEEKTFRDELALFNSDSECCIVEEQHRTVVMSILTRILYGTLQNKKITVSKKGQVFSFLCGCKLEEQLIFIDLVLKPCQEFLVDVTIPELMSSVDLKNMLPPIVMQSFLNIILLIMRKLGHYIKVYLPKLLKVILGIAATSKVCLDNKHKVYNKALAQMKTVWKMSLTRLFQFFDIFKTYPYTPSELDSVFDVVVWPKIQSLPVESLKSPTYLLNFLHAWTKSPRFFPCLLKTTVIETKVSAMPYVFQLLNSKAISKSVLHLVMEMIYNLINVDSVVEDEDVKMEEEGDKDEKNDEDRLKEILVLNGCPKYSHDKKELGIQILKPHIHTLLEYLQNNISSVISNLNRKNASCMELTILSKITNLLTSNKQCSMLISLLLSILAKKGKRSWETELDLLTSILNMMQLIKKDILNHFRKVTCLFVSIKHRRPRQVLCDIVQTLSEKQSSLEGIAKILHQLNSWNPNRIDEPDFHQRISGFKAANKMISEMKELDVNFLIPLVHNCCFFITSIDDFSIKDNSTNCLVTIINQFSDDTSKDKFAYQEIIERTILPQIQAGIGGVNQSIRAEFCTVLRALVIKFSSRKPFNDLVKITDKDPDLDFFENIKHIQAHRRTRALRRLANNLSDYKMEREALLFYLLPIANGYIQTKFKKIEGLQEAAIELLGALCSQLPWKIYEKQLRYYLNKITTDTENHKLMMKIVISILAGFHFDLSNSTCMGPNANGLIKQVIEREEKKDKSKEAGYGEEKDDGDDDDDNDGEDEKKSNIKQSASGKLICPTGLANRIHTSIVKNILPKLYKSLIQKVRSETEHKLAKSKYAEDFEILRVPIALAMVQLLKNLPEESMKSNLPSILLRVCQFLKSRSQDIRKSSRDTLVKIVQSLGPSYFPYILSEMKSALTRGYQLHVLGFTTHSLLQALSGQLKIGDLDSCLKTLIEVFNEDIFGEVAEEKTVEALTSKLMEAKNCKSFNSYQVLAKYMSTNYMTALISPIKLILDNTSSHKVSQKVELVLKRLIIGLSANKSLDTRDLMIFIYSLVCQTLPLLVEKTTDSPKSFHPLETKPESCFLLPKAPTREGKKSKMSKKTNMHILVEFGLKLLFHVFKQSRLKSTEIDHLQLLDPFVNILIDCLASKHIKVIVCTLKSLCIMLKFPLPSIRKNAKKLADSLFVLLNSYAATGAARGENAELVCILFKIVTILVREINYYKLSTEQLHVLVIYCEEDICDYTRHSTAFTLIKAILHRKIDSPEIADMMNIIKQMAITSEVSYVRKQCRETVLRYLLDYSLADKGRAYVEFFVKHLGFSIEAGRLSAIEILTAIIRTFPPHFIADEALFFFLPLSASLINDKSAACRKNIASLIKMLIEKLDSRMRRELFTFVVQWYEDKKLHLQIVAAQLMGIYVEIEKDQFSHQLSTVLPLFNKSLMFDNIKAANTVSYEKNQDHFLYNNLNTLLKVVRCCDVVKNPKWIPQMNKLWEHTQNYLKYPHTWIQLVSGQLFGLLFTSHPPDQLVADILNSKLQKSKQPVPFLVKDGQKKIHSLVMDSVVQLQSPLLQKAQAEQAVKNLVYLTKVIKRLNIAQGIINPSLVSEIKSDPLVEKEEKLEKEKKIEGIIEDNCTKLDEEEKMEEVEDEMKEEKSEDEIDQDEEEEEQEDFEKVFKKYSNESEEEEEEEEEIEEEKIEEVEDEKKNDSEENMEDEESISCDEDDASDGVKGELEEEGTDNKCKNSEVTLPWIVRKMTREAHYENIHNPKCALKRSFVFKWFAAVAVDLGGNLLASVLHIMLPALHRELNDTIRTQDANLKNLTQEVMELLKNTVGVEVFSYKYAIVHRERKERSESRKKQKAIQVVTNPEIAYKRKIKRNLVKKNAKKRKIELLRPEKALKKRKMAK